MKLLGIGIIGTITGRSIQFLQSKVLIEDSFTTC